ncbi:MAG: amino acid ABC transporter permease [Erysipelotrichaceae bacterium]|nr:amino acid ABC transporter permease [Erysipelotrichaceae bacterium]
MNIISFLGNVQKFVPRFLAAFRITIELAVISLIFATIVGIIVGLINTSKSKNIIMRFLRILCNVYINIIRGTPMLVQILIIYYGIPQFLGFRWVDLGGMFPASVVVLTLNAGAYMAEIVRAGIEAVDPGQIEASRSLGLSYGKTMRRIVLPQALRTMLPSIINQFIISIKDTSLMSTIGLAELTNVAKTINANWSSATLALYCYLACYYLIICLSLAQLSKFVERKMSYGRD